jgi:16S rRNA (cytosine1402-N4)-methyltransferase
MGKISQGGKGLTMHTPVLLQKTIDELKVKAGGRYIDATAGEGGHLTEILKKGGIVLGIDWDRKQIEDLKSRLKDQPNLTLVAGNFAQIEEISQREGFVPADGILFDLGLSYKQITTSGRGFSYKNLDESLDMRLDPTKEEKASDIVNTLSSDNLYEILAKYSEELSSKALADALVLARQSRRIETVGDLVRVIDSVIGRKEERVYARVFQALRIAVNDEFENLKKGLEEGLRIIKEEGRIVVITFHSLEDRIVKRFARERNLVSSLVKPKYTAKAFERSAKLRVINKQRKS